MELADSLALASQLGETHTGNAIGLSGLRPKYRRTAIRVPGPSNRQTS